MLYLSFIQANGSDSKTEHQVSYYSTSYFDHQGKKKLQQMRNQQKKEIDMIIQSELKTQEMIKVLFLKGKKSYETEK